MPYRSYFPNPRQFAKLKNKDEMVKLYAEGWMIYQNALAVFAPIAWECKWFIEGKSDRVSLSLPERQAIAKYAMEDKSGPWIPSREGQTLKVPTTKAPTTKKNGKH